MELINPRILIQGTLESSSLLTTSVRSLRKVLSVLPPDPLDEPAPSYREDEYEDPNPSKFFEDTTSSGAKNPTPSPGKK